MYTWADVEPAVGTPEDPMLELLDTVDTHFFLFLNSLHSPYLDGAMYWMTKQKHWYPLFVIVAIAIVRSYRWRSILILVGVAVVITLCDQLTSSIMKPLFGRLRPTHDPEIMHLVHTVASYRGGQYSMASSHAADSLGAAVFLWLTVRGRVRWIWIMFVWSGVFTYTRIYLGVHYPGDILVGGFVGIAIGYGMYRLCALFLRAEKPEILTGEDTVSRDET